MVRISVCPSLTEGLGHSQVTPSQMLAVDGSKMLPLKPSHFRVLREDQQVGTCPLASPVEMAQGSCNVAHYHNDSGTPQVQWQPVKWEWPSFNS